MSIVFLRDEALSDDAFGGIAAAVTSVSADERNDGRN